MILSEVFERFAEDSPVSVMAQSRPGERVAAFGGRRPLRGRRRAAVHARPAVLRRRRPDEPGRLPDPTLDQLRLQEARRGPRRHPKAVYDKIDGVEPAVGAALVRHTAAALGPGHRGDGRAPRALAAGLPRADPRRQPPARHRAPPQAAADRAGRRPAGAGPGGLRPRADAGRRRHPLRGRPRPGAVHDRAGPGAGRARRAVGRRPQLLHDGPALRDRRPRRLVRDPPARLDVDLGGRRRRARPRAGATPGRSSSRRCG